MSLAEFITYCKLSGLIEHQLQTDSYGRKVLIVRDDIRLELLYRCYPTADHATIVKAHLTNGMYGDHSPTLDTITKAFFPDELD